MLMINVTKRGSQFISGTIDTDQELKVVRSAMDNLDSVLPEQKVNGLHFQPVFMRGDWVSWQYYAEPPTPFDDELWA